MQIPLFTMKKVTLVLGASPNPERYAYKAIVELQKRNIPVVAIGSKDSDLGNLKIKTGMPDDMGEIHTITLYLNAKHQKEYYNYLLSLNPKRIIFNPGTSNPEFAGIARRKGIEVVNGCMLIMLNTGKY
jgi:predicted CoA-binding protein